MIVDGSYTAWVRPTRRVHLALSVGMTFTGVILIAAGVLGGRSQAPPSALGRAADSIARGGGASVTLVPPAPLLPLMPVVPRGSARPSAKPRVTATSSAKPRGPAKPSAKPGATAAPSAGLPSAQAKPNPNPNPKTKVKPKPKPHAKPKPHPRHEEPTPSSSPEDQAAGPARTLIPARLPWSEAQKNL